MPHPLRAATAIVGAADAVSSTGTLGRSVEDLEVEMIRDALADAGLDITDVDSVISTNGMMASLDLAERLGVQGRFTDTTMTGGSSFEVHVEHAAMAIANGLCDVAVIVYAATPRGGKNPFASGGPPVGKDSPMFQWDLPYGFGLPAASYSLAASRHMHQYGTTSEQLAQIAGKTLQVGLDPHRRTPMRTTRPPSPSTTSSSRRWSPSRSTSSTVVS